MREEGGWVGGEGGGEEGGEERLDEGCCFDWGDCGRHDELCIDYEAAVQLVVSV